MKKNTANVAILVGGTIVLVPVAVATAIYTILAVPALYGFMYTCKMLQRYDNYKTSRRQQRQK